jgi:hypothetical protein
MIRTIKTCLWGAALVLLACGPGAKIGGGKQGAAEALFAASGPTKGSTDRTAQGIDVTLKDLSVSCQYGGQATLKSFVLQVDTTLNGATSGAHYTMAYDHCGAAKTDVGVAEYNGQWDVTQATMVATGTIKLQQTFKGKVTVNGAFDDFVDADVSQSIDVSSLGATGGTVAVNLVGKISDSSGTYNYNEMVNVTAGNLSVQVTNH